MVAAGSTAIRRPCPYISSLAIDAAHVRLRGWPRTVTDGSDRLELDQPTIHALLEAFDKSDWLEMTVSIGSDRLHVSRRARVDGAPEPSLSEPDPPPPHRAADPKIGRANV